MMLNHVICAMDKYTAAGIAASLVCVIGFTVAITYCCFKKKERQVMGNTNYGTTGTNNLKLGYKHVVIVHCLDDHMLEPVTKRLKKETDLELAEFVSAREFSWKQFDETKDTTEYFFCFLPQDSSPGAFTYDGHMPDLKEGLSGRSSLITIIILSDQKEGLSNMRDLSKYQWHDYKHIPFPKSHSACSIL